MGASIFVKKILYIASRFPYFFASFGVRIFIGGIIVSVVAGLAVMYFFSYRVTKELYQADIQFTKVNVSLLNKVLERIDSKQKLQTIINDRDPFQ